MGRRSGANVERQFLGVAEWPNQVDFSADGLRLRAFPEEAGAEFSGAAKAAIGA